MGLWFCPRSKYLKDTKETTATRSFCSILRFRFRGLSVSSLFTSSPEINVTTHRLIEATKFGYGQRASYGDPAFTANVSTLQENYLTDPVVEEIRTKIVDNQTFPVGYYDPAKLSILNDSGTSHMAVIDKLSPFVSVSIQSSHTKADYAILMRCRDGNSVSLTTTVFVLLPPVSSTARFNLVPFGPDCRNLYWGSQIMTTDGVILNDEMVRLSSSGPLSFSLTNFAHCRMTSPPPAK